MSEKIIVPALGESVTEATVSKWLKSVGEEVTSDEPLVELETDKVNVEVPSPSDGILEKITVKEGTTVEVGSLLGSVGANNANPVVEKKDKKCLKYKSAYETSLLVNGMGVISSKCEIEENKLLKCVNSLSHYSSSSNDS